jgi:hypothetical protein
MHPMESRVIAEQRRRDDVMRAEHVRLVRAARRLRRTRRRVRAGESPVTC